MSIIMQTTCSYVLNKLVLKYSKTGCKSDQMPHCQAKRKQDKTGQNPDQFPAVNMLNNFQLLLLLLCFPWLEEETHKTYKLIKTALTTGLNIQKQKACH